MYGCRSPVDLTVAGLFLVSSFALMILVTSEDTATAAIAANADTLTYWDVIMIIGGFSEILDGCVVSRDTGCAEVV